MYICYVDESGTPDINKNSNTTHFVLAGISLPIEKWHIADKEITKIKSKYDFSDEMEIHTAWLLRKYIEQIRIPNFDKLNYENRRKEVIKKRSLTLNKLRKGKKKNYDRTKSDYKKTNPYIHLTLQERTKFVEEIAEAVEKWDYVRLFAECVDKIHFDPNRSEHNVGEAAFDQLISRFDTFLKIESQRSSHKLHGIIVHDNIVGVAERMQMMRSFFQEGTRYLNTIDYVIETPLFVDSKLTSMVQIADLCAYALRRYIEKNERNLFDKVFKRADIKNDKLVSIRHFTSKNCTCELCSN